MPCPAQNVPHRLIGQAVTQIGQHIVRPDRVRDGIHTVLPGQFDCSLPQRLRQLRPPRLGTAKLIQRALQLQDG
jgi:hypothetical protein